MRADFTGILGGLVLAAGMGCGPVVPGGATSVDTIGGSTTEPSTTDPTVISTGPTGGAQGTESTSASTTTVMEGSSGASVTGTFLIPLDGVGGGSCGVLAQDCPPGEKCMPYADDGGGSWNNSKCVPVMENPAQHGEACFVVDSPASGIDNCDAGLMCWYVDLEMQGYCAAMCKGTIDAPYCEEPAETCAIYGGGDLALCLRTCDPLVQDCEAGFVCIGSSAGVGFLCALDASGEEGQQHDPCMFGNECDPGLRCADVSAAVECDQDDQGCCEPFCDIDDPDADAKCGGVGQVCVTYFDGRPDPEHENVGYCAVPE